jgi:hypothetical protein
MPPFVAVALWHPLWRSLDRHALQRFIEANKAELGTQEFWIDEAGFGNRTPVGSPHHVWSAIFAASDTPEFGYVGARARLYMIPKDTGPDDVSRFMRELKLRRERAVEQ